MVKKRIGLAAIALLVLMVVPTLHGQGQIQPPKFGQFTVGDDYFLANYTQLQEYWAALDKASDRMQVVEIGKTEEGRPQLMAIITSPENHKNLEKYRDISVRLARAEGITEEQARTLATQGKAVVWVDGGLHATEIVNSMMLYWMAYQMVSQNDPETMRLLNDVILLLVQANPDGQELTANWYMRPTDVKQRNMQLPKVYNKYVGHDDNRDSYASNQLETQNINRQMYVNWIPQIMYNAHQTGPEGAIVFVPPFRDPFNYNHDPLVPIGIEIVAGAIRSRWTAEGKAGFASRDAASYSTWFNGGDRTMTGFHNQVGILTEISGNPTPIEIGLVLSRQLPDSNVPLPIPPQKVWHFKQSIDYIVSAARAHMDIASRMKDQWLFRIWRMGMNSIERGSKDNWTLQPRWIYEAQAAAAKEASAGEGGRPGEVRVGSAEVVPSKYYDFMRKPERKDPRVDILPADQADMPTVVKFLNMLIRGGIEVQRATGAFTVGGKNYPAGSYVIKAAQAFRPHLRDMLEPQDHPDDFFYPGGPPKPPYDVAGYTLAFTMGIQFDRVLEAFDGPFEKLPFGEQIKVLAGKVAAPAKGSAAGYLLSHQVKDSFTATNRLLAGKEEVWWLKAPLTVAGKTYPAGTLYVPGKATTKALLEKLAAEIGVTFEGTPTKPTGDAYKLRTMKVGLADYYGGSMASGWVRWMFERQFQFTTFEVVYPPQMDAGGLKAKYDVIVFMEGVPAPGEKPRAGAPPTNLPPEWADKVGNVTPQKTIPALKQFVEEGGTIIAVGSATNIAYHLGLPVSNHLVERTPTGGERPLGSDKYFVPGSVLRVAVDTSNPVAFGMPADLDVMFSRDPVFRLGPDAAVKGTKAIAWYPNATPLRSGWAWGQNFMEGGLAAVESSLGKGKVYLYCPEITFRGQPHGTFPFLFNSIYLAGAQSANLSTAGRSR